MFLSAQYFCNFCLAFSNMAIIDVTDSGTIYFGRAWDPMRGIILKQGCCFPSNIYFGFFDDDAMDSIALMSLLFEWTGFMILRKKYF